jgi:hypothetical protein
LRNGAEARSLAEKCCALQGGKPDPNHLDTLAATLAECGEFSRAIEVMERALKQAPDELREQMREHLRLYRKGQPVRLT